MSHMRNIAMVAATLFILAIVIPAGVLKILGYALVAIWVFIVAAFGLLLAWHYYKHRGDVAKR